MMQKSIPWFHAQTCTESQLQGYFPPACYPQSRCQRDRRAPCSVASAPPSACLLGRLPNSQPFRNVVKPLVFWFLCSCCLHFYGFILIQRASLGGSVVKNLPANAGDAILILGLKRFPGEGDGNPLQYPCLGNPVDRGAWRATVHKRVGHDLVAKQQQLV